MTDGKLYAGQTILDDIAAKYNAVNATDLGDRAIEALKAGDGIARYLMTSKDVLQKGSLDEQVKMFKEFPQAMNMLGHQVTQKEYDFANAVASYIAQGKVAYGDKLKAFEALTRDYETVIREHGECSGKISDLTTERDALRRRIGDSDKFKRFYDAFKDGLEAVLPELIVGDTPVTH